MACYRPMLFQHSFRERAMGEKGALGHVKPVNLKCHCFSDFIVAIAFTDVSKEYLPRLSFLTMHPTLSCVFLQNYLLF